MDVRRWCGGGGEVHIISSVYTRKAIKKQRGLGSWFLFFSQSMPDCTEHPAAFVSRIGKTNVGEQVEGSWPVRCITVTGDLLGKLVWSLLIDSLWV